MVLALQLLMAAAACFSLHAAPLPSHVSRLQPVIMHEARHRHRMQKARATQAHARGTKAQDKTKLKDNKKVGGRAGRLSNDNAALRRRMQARSSGSRRIGGHDNKALLEWVAGTPGAFVSDALKVAVALGVRGLFAHREVVAGETLVVLPSAIQLGPGSLQAEAFDVELAAALGRVEHWSARLGLALCAEVRRGASSDFASYIGSLPAAFGSPFTCDATDLLAAWPPTAARAQQMRRGVCELHARVCPDSLPLADFAWATACAGSRAYRVRGAVGERAGDVARLLPLIDLANYRPADRASCELVSASSREDPYAVALVASRDLPAGAELTVDYGHGVEFANERLLLEYGFVIDGLRSDRVGLPLAAMGAALESMSTAHAEAAEGTEAEVALATLQRACLAALLPDGATDEAVTFDAFGQPTERTQALALVLTATCEEQLTSFIRNGRVDVGAMTFDALLPAAGDGHARGDDGASADHVARAARALRLVAASALKACASEAAGIPNARQVQQQAPADAAQFTAWQLFTGPARAYCASRCRILERASCDTCDCEGKGATSDSGDC